MSNKLQSIQDDVELLQDATDCPDVAEYLDLLLCTLISTAESQQLCTQYLVNKCHIVPLLNEYLNTYTAEYVNGAVAQHNVKVTWNQFKQLLCIMYQLLSLLHTHMSIEPLTLSEKRHPLYAALKIYYSAAIQNKDVEGSTEKLESSVLSKQDKLKDYIATAQSSSTAVKASSTAGIAYNNTATRIVVSTQQAAPSPVNSTHSDDFELPPQYTDSSNHTTIALGTVDTVKKSANVDVLHNDFKNLSHNKTVEVVAPTIANRINTPFSTCVLKNGASTHVSGVSPPIPHRNGTIINSSKYQANNDASKTVKSITPLQLTVEYGFYESSDMTIATTRIAGYLHTRYGKVNRTALIQLIDAQHAIFTVEFVDSNVANKLLKLSVPFKIDNKTIYKVTDSRLMNLSDLIEKPLIELYLKSNGDHSKLIRSDELLRYTTDNVHNTTSTGAFVQPATNVSATKRKPKNDTNLHIQYTIKCPNQIKDQVNAVAARLGGYLQTTYRVIPKSISFIDVTDTGVLMTVTFNIVNDANKIDMYTPVRLSNTRGDIAYTITNMKSVESIPTRIWELLYKSDGKHDTVVWHNQEIANNWKLLFSWSSTMTDWRNSVDSSTCATTTVNTTVPRNINTGVNTTDVYTPNDPRKRYIVNAGVVITCSVSLDTKLQNNTTILQYIKSLCSSSVRVIRCDSNNMCNVIFNTETEARGVIQLYKHHTVEQYSMTVNQATSKICKLWARDGTCPDGRRCDWAHPELRN